MTPRQRANRRDEAALLVAQDEQTDAEIASAVGIDKTTLERWKRDPAFAAAVATHRTLWAEQLAAEGIANKRNRVARLNERAELLDRVIAERAADPNNAGIPGGTTGLIVGSPMLIKVYEAGDLDDDDAGMYPTKETRIILEYKIDTGLLKELRAHEQQAAQELGQWVEKKDVEHSGTVVLVREYEGVPEDFV